MLSNAIWTFRQTGCISSIGVGADGNMTFDYGTSGTNIEFPVKVIDNLVGTGVDTTVSPRLLGAKEVLSIWNRKYSLAIPYDENLTSVRFSSDQVFASMFSGSNPCDLIDAISLDSSRLLLFTNGSFVARSRPGTNSLQPYYPRVVLRLYYDCALPFGSEGTGEKDDPYILERYIN